MKLVCIDNNDYFDHLTLGKIYDLILCIDDNFDYILTDNGCPMFINKYAPPSERFLTLREYRKLKLQRLNES